MEISKILEAVTDNEASYLQQLLSNPASRLILHSDVELTEEEIIEALITAKSNKYARQQAEEINLRKIRAFNDLTRPYTPAEMIDYCHKFYLHRFGKEFIVDENNKALFEKLSLYFTDSKEFEVGEYKLSKGILIMGNVGVGKTEIMRFFQKNKKCCFRIVSCNDVSNDYLVYRDDFDGIYSTPTPMAVNDADVFYQRVRGFCFDDLGTEDVKNNFGNKKNVMADVILDIYSKKIYGCFHITTNLSSEEIETMYGSRVKSRLREMFNVFDLPGTDRRK